MKPRDFVEFKYMVTPPLIQFIWGLGTLVILIGGLITMFQSRQTANFLMSLGGMILSLIGWRVTCEVVILLFRIHDAIRELLPGREAKV